MAAAQRKYPGRLWASAAVPLVDTKIASFSATHTAMKFVIPKAKRP